MDNRSKGKIGEDIACLFLQKKGFIVLERNYQRKWGEIDIVATKDKMLHFFEVKSVNIKSLDLINYSRRPEENVHNLKIRNIRRTIESYLDEKGGGFDNNFSFHVLCVFKDVIGKKARVKWIDNVIL